MTCVAIKLVVAVCASVEAASKGAQMMRLNREPHDFRFHFFTQLDMFAGGKYCCGSRGSHRTFVAIPGRPTRSQC